MRFASVCLALLSSAATSAFVIHRQQPTKASTALHISSWGTKGSPAFRVDEREDPAKKVQAYLKEPEPVEARNTIDGTCLVSGLIQPGGMPASDDQFLFDLLNHEESAFEFDTIVAYCSDTKLARKRLISRSARYTGLLNKLDFLEGDGLPSAESLEGAKSWVAYVEGDDLLAKVNEIAQTAGASSTLTNVAILLVGANELDVAASSAALDALKASGKTYTLVAVGQVTDAPEGKSAYHFADFATANGTLPEKAIFSRQEGFRMVTELLQLEAGSNKALAFAEIYNENATEVRLIKGLREAGYDRMQEVDHMIQDGPAKYLQAVEDYKKANPDAAKGYTTNAWWEREEFQESARRIEEKLAREESKEKDARTKEIEAIAAEWVKREYFRQSMAGTIENDMTEEEFRETVWERAMLEGDLKYRQKNGEIVDEEAELEDFQKRQEKKQEELLKKAKKELAEVLGEDAPSDLKDE